MNSILNQNLIPLWQKSKIGEMKRKIGAEKCKIDKEEKQNLSRSSHYPSSVPPLF